MTGREMNGADRLFVMKKSGLVLATALGGLLAGCASVDIYKPKVDQNSAAAARVEAIAANPGPYPRWSTFPAAPQDVPTLEQFSDRVAASEQDQRELLTSTANFKWSLRRTQVFARDSLSEINPALAGRAPADAAARTAAFAKDAQALATPPSPAK
jgi:hypothetical protein